MGHVERTGGRERRASDETGDAVIVEAAIAAMFENGYHGTSVREIADRAGMSVANVYYYFQSKHDLLFQFMDNSAKQLLAQLEDAVSRAPDEPAARLAVVVRVFVERHTLRQAAAFVAATELRALDDDARATVVSRRNAIEALFREVVRDGVQRGAFTAEDPHLAVRAILDMASSVSSWYRAGGGMSGAEIADRYVALALALVGALPNGGGEPSAGSTGEPVSR